MRIIVVEGRLLCNASGNEIMGFDSGVLLCGVVCRVLSRLSSWFERNGCKKNIVVEEFYIYLMALKFKFLSLQTLKLKGLNL